ncbi:hypothetical protein [Priestia endophytica]|uniref:hypothetical protein n=1 Tax=Priestia endophytica TaxID=135735 RepID=UPI000DCA8A98|nr:hypothetical protein [Priestia endophytica]RAS86114.1 hypothetical protein A4U60_08405 [Priestia endophytica]
MKGENLKVIGSESFAEKQKLTDLSVKGAATFHQDVEVKNFYILGRCKIEGHAKAEKFVNKGSCFVGSRLICDKFLNVGQGHIEEVHANAINSSGSLEVTRSILCKMFQSKGRLKVNGQLTGSYVSIETSAPSRINYITGEEEVIIRSGKSPLLNVMSFGKRKLTTYSISGNRVEIERTEAVRVCGEVVRIGEGCRVKEVFYTKELDVHPSSFVGASTHIQTRGR